MRSGLQNQKYIKPAEIRKVFAEWLKAIFRMVRISEGLLLLPASNENDFIQNSLFSVLAHRIAGLSDFLMKFSE
jgi:hypothetical protein